MKSLFWILLLVVVAVGGYVVLNAEKVTEPAPVMPVKKAHDGKVHVVCPLCSGEGSILQIYQRAHAEESETRYRCPLCYGKGERILVVKPGMVRCPNCYGMGYAAYLDKEHLTRRQSVASRPPPGGKYGGGDGIFLKRPCGRCRSSGVIVATRR